MNQFTICLFLNLGVVFSQTYISPPKIKTPKRAIEPIPSYFQPIQVPHSQYTSNCYNNGYANPSHFCALPPPRVVEANPLLATLLLSSNYHLHPDKIPGYNHKEHLPLNPYLALLLSHYGKYTPIYGKSRGLYGYVAANNYHNNQPIGAYKVYEDGDGH